MNKDDAVDLPVNSTLDLHFFRPRDIDELIPDYINECRKKGIYQVRIVHGKGTGILRKRVHSILSKLQEVESYSLGGESAGSWGATIVILKPP